MTDEFDLQSKIAFYKRRQADEAAQALAARREKEQSERQARREQQELMTTRTTEIPLLVTKFHRWAVRHNVPGELFRPAFHMSRLTGWRIASWSDWPSYSGSYMDFSSTFILLLGENGRMYETSRQSGNMTAPPAQRRTLEDVIANTKFTLDDMTNSIAEIVAKSGKPWPR